MPLQSRDREGAVLALDSVSQLITKSGKGNGTIADNPPLD